GTCSRHLADGCQKDGTPPMGKGVPHNTNKFLQGLYLFGKMRAVRGMALVAGMSEKYSATESRRNW
ncbi:MAG: hypothetical protein NT045_04075, partial [Candidatus Aureabacteria bacterium]|nr:hypothetical protein [Candidatus Auribacterota bacterium]